MTRNPTTKPRGRHRKHRLYAWRGNLKEVAARSTHPFMDYVEQYLQWRRMTGASERSVQAHDDALVTFVDWWEVRGVREPRELTRAVLETYQRYLFLMRKADGEPLSIRTQLLRLLRLMGVRGWCAWLSRERVIEHNAAADLVLPSAPKSLPKSVPSVGQIARLMAQPDLSEETGVRDRAMLEVLYSTGMRRMELCNLSLADVDLEQGTVWIRHGKGKRDRFIPLGARAGEWVGRYLEEVRPRLMVRADDWSLFLTDYGEAYQPSRLATLVRRYMRLAGLMQGGGVPRAAARMRDAHAGGRSGHPVHPGAAGRCGAVDDADLYARGDREAEDDPRDDAPDAAGPGGPARRGHAAAGGA